MVATRSSRVAVVDGVLVELVGRDIVGSRVAVRAQILEVTDHAVRRLGAASRSARSHVSSTHS